MDSFTLCFILFTVGMPILYAINECRKLRLKQIERGNLAKDALYQEQHDNQQDNEEENVESSDSDKPLDDTPLTEAESAKESAKEMTASISVQYRGRIDVKKMLESLVTEDKFKETSVDLDKILSEILNQQKKN
jgi:hypothetical protein